MNLWKFAFICVLLSDISLAGERFKLRLEKVASLPIGIYVFPPYNWPKTYLVIANDRGRSEPSAYLDYNFIVSDVMPPWTSSEYKAIRSADGKLSLMKNREPFANLEISTKQRHIESQSLLTSCALYDLQQNITAYCVSTGARNLVVKDTKHTLLGKIEKKSSDLDWEIYIENANDNPIKSALFMLAGLHSVK